MNGINVLCSSSSTTPHHQSGTALSLSLALALSAKADVAVVMVREDVRGTWREDCRQRDPQGQRRPDPAGPALGELEREPTRTRSRRTARTCAARLVAGRESTRAALCS
jgi:hypothetical protein